MAQSLIGCAADPFKKVLCVLEQLTEWLQSSDNDPTLLVVEIDDINGFQVLASYRTRYQATHPYRMRRSN